MKRHIISALVTFVTAFSLYFVTVIDTITLSNLTDGTVVSLAFVGVRAGIKAILEYWVLNAQ